MEDEPVTGAADDDWEDDQEGDDEIEGDDETEVDEDREIEGIIAPAETEEIPTEEVEPEDEIGEELLSVDEGENDVTELHRVVKQREQMFTTIGIPTCMTKYEMASVIGYRAQQLAEGAHPYVSVKEGMDPIAIAIEEFDQGLIPLVIERPYPASKICHFKYRVFRLNDLTKIITPK